jgi:hypothetical protein
MSLAIACHGSIGEAYPMRLSVPLPTGVNQRLYRNIDECEVQECGERKSIHAAAHQWPRRSHGATLASRVRVAQGEARHAPS